MRAALDELGALGEILDRQAPVDRRLAQQRERDVTVGVAGPEHKAEGTSAPPATVNRGMPESTANRQPCWRGLNEPQRDAVTHGEGPLLILAGAGSGKTRVLTHRIAYLLRTGQARADEILAITFTNKAAQEMRERVELLVGRATRAMWVMTFHSACARMLRADAHRLGYTRQFTIYDAADSRRLIKKCLDDLDIDVKRFTPRAMQSQISDAKNKLRSADDYRQMVGSFFEQTVADVYEHYEREIHRMNAMDFDDLLFRAVNLLELFQEVRDRYSNAFRWVLVDEYQDTNHAQYRWLQLLASEHRNLAVVGDDDQCLIEGTPVTMGDGSIKPIEEIRVGDEVLSCYGSGDFRPAKVTGVHEARARLGIRIRTAGGRELISTPEHTHFAGFRKGHAPDAHWTYLMSGGKGFRVGVTRTYNSSRDGSRGGLATRAMQEAADAGWILRIHESEAEARASEAELSLRYGIPTLPFRARPTGTAGGLVGNQALIDRIFERVDSDAGGFALLEAEGLDVDVPHHVPRSHEGRRREHHRDAVRRPSRPDADALHRDGRPRPRGEARAGVDRAERPPGEGRVAELAVRIGLQELGRPDGCRVAHPDGAALLAEVRRPLRQARRGKVEHAAVHPRGLRSCPACTSSLPTGPTTSSNPSSASRSTAPCTTSTWRTPTTSSPTT